MPLVITGTNKERRGLYKTLITIFIFVEGIKNFRQDLCTFKIVTSEAKWYFLWVYQNKIRLCLFHSHC